LKQGQRLTVQMFSHAVVHISAVFLLTHVAVAQAKRKRTIKAKCVTDRLVCATQVITHSAIAP